MLLYATSEAQIVDLPIQPMMVKFARILRVVLFVLLHAIAMCGISGESDDRVFRRGDDKAIGRNRRRTYCLRDRVAPTLFCLGAQKAATTSIASDMKKSFENLLFGKSLESFEEPWWFWKEKHYFGGGFIDYYGDLNRYLSHYPLCSKNASETNDVAADFTPELSYNLAAERILDTYGEQLANRIVFLVVLREPLLRLASEFLFMMFHSFRNNGSQNSGRFKLWEDFDAYVKRYPETREWSSWSVHHSTRDEILNRTNDVMSRDGTKRERWIASTFGRWLDAQLAMTSSCYFRDKVPLTRLWPDCGRRSIFSGIYSAQLLHWFRTFSPKQFVVTSMSAYISSPNALMDAVGRRMDLRCRVSHEFGRARTVGFDSALQPTSNAPKQRSCDVHLSKASHLNARNQFGADDLLKAMRKDGGKHNDTLRSMEYFYGMYDDSLRVLLESSWTPLDPEDEEAGKVVQVIVPDATELHVSELREDPAALHRPWSLSRRNSFRAPERTGNATSSASRSDFERIIRLSESILQRTGRERVKDIFEGRLPEI